MDDPLAEAADHLYDACCLFEDEDLDPSNHAEVIRRAYGSSDCDAFASALAELTGWTTSRMTWTVGGEPCHHALVRSPDGRLLDVCGWTDLRRSARRYGARDARLVEAAPTLLGNGLLDEDGLDEELARTVRVIRNLPWAPYDNPDFKGALRRDVPGVDVPVVDVHTVSKVP